MSMNYMFRKGKLSAWYKVLLPKSRLQNYPPVFSIRNPVFSCVSDAHKTGFEVAILSFYIQNHQQLREFLGREGMKQYIDILKKEFAVCIKEHFQQDLLILHDYYSDGLTALIRRYPHHQRINELDMKAETVESCLESRMNTAYKEVPSSFKTGYMFIERNGENLPESINKAHQMAFSMAEKKEQSKYNQMVYDMSQIIANKSVRLLVQPIFQVSTNEKVAYEVLSRGTEGTFFENPLNLFSFARQAGMLYELEMIVLKKAMAELSRMDVNEQIYINFTPITIGNKHFFSDVKQILNQYKHLSPKQIVFEITERDEITDLDLLIRTIGKLREFGIRIAVDDTGAGYASLHTIIEVMPDIIKIDRSVIKDIDNSTVKESMLKGLLLIAREIGSTVVAEGIESEKEAMILSKNKVDLAQGYFYARPSTIETVSASPA